MKKTKIVLLCSKIIPFFFFFFCMSCTMVVLVEDFHFEGKRIQREPEYPFINRVPITKNAPYYQVKVYTDYEFLTIDLSSQNFPSRKSVPVFFGVMPLFLPIIPFLPGIILTMIDDEGEHSLESTLIFEIKTNFLTTEEREKIVCTPSQFSLNVGGKKIPPSEVLVQECDAYGNKFPLKTLLLSVEKPEQKILNNLNEKKISEDLKRQFEEKLKARKIQLSKEIEVQVRRKNKSWVFEDKLNKINYFVEYKEAQKDSKSQLNIFAQKMEEYEISFNSLFIQFRYELNEHGIIAEEHRQAFLEISGFKKGENKIQVPKVFIQKKSGLYLDWISQI